MYVTTVRFIYLFIVTTLIPGNRLVVDGPVGGRPGPTAPQADWTARICDPGGDMHRVKLAEAVLTSTPWLPEAVRPSLNGLAARADLERATPVPAYEEALAVFIRM